MPLVNILVIKSHKSLTCKVYYKPTNKSDYKYVYSHQNNKIKTDLIKGFYLRALRMCTPQYLNEEFEYKKNSLKILN